MSLALILFVGMSAAGTTSTHAPAAKRPAIAIHGEVHYPDGTPAASVGVHCSSACDFEMVHSGQDTTTDAHGAFVIQWRIRECDLVWCSASDDKNLWLPIGYNTFLEDDNGTTSTITVTPNSVPDPISIMFAALGGELTFEIVDAKTRAPRHASVVLHRLPTSTFFMGMSVDTGPHGEKAVRLLPAGEYTAQLSSFDCHGKTYFVPPEFPSSSLQVVAGTRALVPLAFDFSTIDAWPPGGAESTTKCRP